MRSPGANVLHRRFVIAASTARLSSEGLPLALVLLSVQRTGSAAEAGVVIAACTFPQLALGPALGPALDRSAVPWRLLGAAAMANALAVVGLLLAVGEVPVAIAVVIGLVVAATEPLMTGGLSATAVSTLGPDTDQRIQRWDSFAYNIGGVAAPGAVTLAALAFSAAVSMTLLAAGSVLAALALALLGSTLRRVRSPNAARAHLHIAAAIRSIVASRPLLSATASTTIAQASLGALSFAAVAAARLDGRAPASAGTVVTAISLGAFVGSAAMTRWPVPLRPETTVLAALAAVGLLFVAGGVVPWVVLIAVSVVVGLLDAPLLVGTFAARTEYAPAEVRATVFTVGASAKLGATSLGAIAGGAWLSGRATGAGLVGIGVAHLVAVVIGVSILGLARPGKPRST